MARGGTMTLKSPQEIAKMRVARARRRAGARRDARAVRPGMTTAQLDAVGEAVIRKAGAKPSFKGLYGFPGSVCVAVNEEVVHGIPGKRALKERRHHQSSTPARCSMAGMATRRSPYRSAR